MIGGYTRKRSKKTSHNGKAIPSQEQRHRELALQRGRRPIQDPLQLPMARSYRRAWEEPCRLLTSLNHDANSGIAVLAPT